MVRTGSMPVVASNVPITTSELKGTKVPARKDAIAIPR
jgi:hypothetical protein